MLVREVKIEVGSAERQFELSFTTEPDAILIAENSSVNTKQIIKCVNLVIINTICPRMRDHLIMES